MTPPATAPALGAGLMTPPATRPEVSWARSPDLPGRLTSLSASPSNASFSNGRATVAGTNIRPSWRSSWPALATR
jgi:hypothetical protein